MQKLGERLIPLVYIAYLAMGFVQLFAVADGISLALGTPAVLSYIGAFFVTWIPLVGIAAGVYGAHASWGWSWLNAALLFGWPFVAGIVVTMIAGTAEFFGRKSN
jgi:hypothetical protein